jgi:hypothetical protein
MREKNIPALNCTLFTIVALLPAKVLCQGTLVFDQQSADETTTESGVGDIQSNQPIGQSFTPSLTAIGFTRLWFMDFHVGDGLGAAVYVNLRTNSISGAVLAQTAPVFMPDGFGATGSRGFTNFLFSAEVALTPGATYYLQPVVQSGSPDWGINAYHFGYTGGTMFLAGQPVNINDLWFREGILVPEPTAASVAVLSGIIFAYARKSRNRS